MLLQSHYSLVADLTTTRVLPQPTVNPVINSLHPCPLSLSFAAVCHFMQATPSAKGVACVTIHCCHRCTNDIQMFVFCTILLYIDERPIYR